MPLLFMATSSLVSVREYLSTSYRPDCDLRGRGGRGAQLGRIRPRTSTKRGAFLFSCPAEGVGNSRRARAARASLAHPLSRAGCLCGTRRTGGTDLQNAAVYLHRKIG